MWDAEFEGFSRGSSSFPGSAGVGLQVNIPRQQDGAKKRASQQPFMTSPQVSHNQNSVRTLADIVNIIFMLSDCVCQVHHMWSVPIGGKESGSWRQRLR